MLVKQRQFSGNNFCTHDIISLIVKFVENLLTNAPIEKNSSRIFFFQREKWQYKNCANYSKKIDLITLEKRDKMISEVADALMSSVFNQLK